MARKPMVTRTITTTKCKVLCVDIEQQSPVTKEITVSQTYKDEKKLFREICKVLASDTLKPVHIISSEVIEALYGMEEQEFLKVASPLPPRKKA